MTRVLQTALFPFQRVRGCFCFVFFFFGLADVVCRPWYALLRHPFGGGLVLVSGSAGGSLRDCLSCRGSSYPRSVLPR